MSETRLVRIRWRSQRTGAEGRGEPMPRPVAEDWLESIRAKNRFPDLVHWIEEHVRECQTQCQTDARECPKVP